MKSKAVFKDSPCDCFSIESSWRQSRASIPRKTQECQTSTEIYSFQEMETQTGIKTAIVQDQVSQKNQGISLVEHYARKYKKVPEEEWARRIADGFVTVDCAVVTDKDSKVDTDYFLEFVDVKHNKETQTSVVILKDDDDSVSTAVQKGITQFLNKVVPMVINELTANAESIFSFPTNGLMGENSIVGEPVTYWNTLSVDLERKKYFSLIGPRQSTTLVLL